jgi:hypothetical protein
VRYGYGRIRTSSPYITTRRNRALESGNREAAGQLARRFFFVVRIADYFAIPVIGTSTDGRVGSSLVTVRSALKVPALVGEKVTFTLFDLWGENENGPVPEVENGALAGPLMVPVSMPLPRLATFTFLLA